MKRLLFILYLLSVFLGTSCVSAQDSNSFLQLRMDEKRERILDYPLQTQVDLYLETMMVKHPPDLALADVIAKHGVSLVPILKKKIANEEGVAIVHLVDVFLRMQESNYFQVANDVELMSFLNTRINSMRDEGWKGIATSILDDIKEAASNTEKTMIE